MSNSDAADDAPKVDGNYGVGEVAALLAKAIGAESTPGSMAEDGAKIDLKFSFGSLLMKGKATIHCQVKTGNSYKAASSTRHAITLANIHKKDLEILGTHRPSMLVWLSGDPVPINLYRFVRRTMKTPVDIRVQFSITPAFHLDMSRELASMGSTGFPRITLPPPPPDDKALMAQARTAYRALKKAGAIPAALTVPIDVTRMGWRHITRWGRASKKRRRSFRLIPYLPKLLAYRPSRYLIANRVVVTVKDRMVDSREVIFWYEHAILADGVDSLVLIRIREEIEYPANWMRGVYGRSQIKTRATLLGWWYKPTKEMSSASVTHTAALS